MKKSTKLQELLTSGRSLLMPDAYDPISARIIQSCGFQAVQCSGCSIAIANCLKHESELSLDQNLNTTRKIVSAVDVPVMADGEDGYGGPERIGQTVAAFIDSQIGKAFAGAMLKMEGRKQKAAGFREIDEFSWIRDNRGTFEFCRSSRSDACSLYKEEDRIRRMRERYVGHGVLTN